MRTTAASSQEKEKWGLGVCLSRHFYRHGGEDGCTFAAAADDCVQRWSSASLLWGPEERLQRTLPIPEARSGSGPGEAPLSRRNPTTFCLPQEPVHVRDPGTVHRLAFRELWGITGGCLSCRLDSGWRSSTITSNSKPPLVLKGRRTSRGAATGTTGWVCFHLRACLHGIPAGTCTLFFVWVRAATDRLHRLLQNTERGYRAAAQTLRPLHPQNHADAGSSPRLFVSLTVWQLACMVSCF